MGLRERKVSDMLTKSHLLFKLLVTFTITESSICFSRLKTPAIMEKQVVTSFISIAFCKLLTQGAHQQGHSAV